VSDSELTSIDTSGNWPSVELYNAISDQAVRAAGTDVAQRVSVRPLDSEHDILIDKAGDHKIRRKVAPRRNHRLTSAADVCQYADRTAGMVDEFGTVMEPVIWIGPNAVVVTNDADRLRGDSATYTLKQTDLYAFLCKMGAVDGYSQGDFLQLLRVDLARAFASDETRLSLIRNVRSVRAQQQSTIGQGSGSFEANLVSQANQAIDWPDSFLLEVAPLDDPSVGSLCTVEVILDVRPDDKVKPFKLAPIKVDLTNAMQKALKETQEYITENVTDIPVFQGAPTVQ
jgi:hypothetical protein